MKIRLKFLDYAAILFSLLIAVGAALYVYAGSSGPLRVRVQTDSGTYLYSLDEDRQVAAEGPLGTTYIEIQDGHAAVVESPCPNKLCIQAGDLHEHGDWSACMPNKVFVDIEGGESTSDVDVTTY